MGSGSEYERVELPLVEQLKRMGWKHIEATKSDPPSITGRDSFRETILLDRLRPALRRINRDDDDSEWLNDGRINQAISQLSRPQATSLLEINDELTEKLLRGVTVEGVPGWDGGRDRIVQVPWILPARWTGSLYHDRRAGDARIVQ